MTALLPHPVLSTHPEKPAISREGCRLDLLVQLNTPPLAAGGKRRQPVAIAIVIDRSGSMAGAKLSAARSAAQQLVQLLTPDDRVAVVSFDGEVRLEAPLGPPSPEAIERIGRMRAGGQTALFEGWRQGMAALRDAAHLEQHQKRVLLLTDGRANVGPRHRTEVVPAVEHAWGEGISTSCIGLGENYEERLLTAMVEVGSGNLVHLTSPGQLEAVFLAELEGLNLALGRDLRLRLRPAPGVAVARLHNPLPVAADGWIALGALQAGTAPSLALQLQILPPTDPDGELLELLQVEACWLDTEGRLQRLEAVLRLPLLEAASWRALPADPDVVREVLLQGAARQRRQAMEEIDLGDVDSSREAVHSALSSLDLVISSAETERERHLLGELLDLIDSNKLSLARKVMGTQVFMRARGRRLRDEEGRDHG